MALLREPREDAIMDIGSMTGLHREDAIRWLKAYDNDANKAMDAFFENPNAIHDQQSQVKFDDQQGQVRWDEDHFHMDKTNNSQQGQNQLGIHGSDALRPNIFNDGAPSRPPSRVSARANTAADSANQGLNMETEDEQVKRAMAMSMSDSQTLPDQETGVLENKAFGPATREHYDTEKWAMTLTGPHTQEIILDPDPADRTRPEGAPAFLKPSSTGHRLPALLKILHAIPMAREALLNRTHVLSDYGYEKDWWAGTAIQSFRTVALDLEGNQIDNDEMIHEVQRLMGFLDETERAYGSTDVLVKPEVMGENQNNKITNFYAAWHDATLCSVLDAPLAGIFTSVGNKVSTENSQSERFYSLMARVDDEISGKGLTLYDVLDHMLWSDNQDDEETFLGKVGDVFTLEVCNQVTSVPGLGIEVPAIWYADRYLPSSTKQVKDMLSRKAGVCAELDCQEKALAGVTQYSNAQTGASIEATDLLAKAARYFEETVEHKKTIGNFSGSTARFQNAASASSGPDGMVQELKVLSEDISSKLQVFEEARESSREQLKEISQMYTKPSGNTEQPPHHKFTLRGVSTNPHTTFVLERTKPETEDDIFSTDAKDWQWWKLEFVRDDTKPVVNVKVTEDDVLKAATTQSPNVLLVYASEAAVSYQSDELPSQLRNFVRADNLSFSRELEGSAHPQSNTPTKRKVLDDDNDGFEGSHQRSPPHDRNIVKMATSNENLDPNLPSFNSSTSRSQAHSSQRANPLRPGNARGFDDVIPTSLQSREFATDHDNTLLDEGGTINGQEMQERGGDGQSLLRHREGSRGQYTLGSYVPELEMEDDDEDEDQRALRGG